MEPPGLTMDLTEDASKEAHLGVLSVLVDSTIATFTIHTRPVPAVSETKRPAVEHDLWTMAFLRAEFNQKESELLLKAFDDQKDDWSALGFVKKVTDLTQVQCHLSGKSGWRCNRSGGGRVAVARQAENILSAVLQLKDLVSAGLKFDATGYGATAWSLVTFSLQVSAVFLNYGVNTTNRGSSARAKRPEQNGTFARPINVLGRYPCPLHQYRNALQRCRIRRLCSVTRLHCYRLHRRSQIGFRGEEGSGQWDLPFVPALSFVVLSHKLTKQQTGS
jgi:hypothetical protein